MPGVRKPPMGAFGSKGVPSLGTRMPSPMGKPAPAPFAAPSVKKSRAAARIAKPRGGKFARLANVKI